MLNDNIGVQVEFLEKKNLDVPSVRQKRSMICPITRGA